MRYGPEEGITVPAIPRRYHDGELVTDADNSVYVDPDRPGWVYATIDA